jgi:hypothetical protein
MYTCLLAPSGLLESVPNPHASAALPLSSAHAEPSKAEQFSLPAAEGLRPVKASGSRSGSQTTLMLIREVVVGPVPAGQERERKAVSSEVKVEVLKRERDSVHCVMKLLREVLFGEMMGWR